ncbi:unnamed protein product [Bursaphelenchus xylophilus]|uniref:(pine wood nematode) hypothetical protein n=1 Tax=Bursaphelenchus xylophilus TaxID=6326 RepID=A0A1I7SDM2_BURXY|nr:unnamed protein product [Bursaphelenchus xylophilus]CAG9120868.1 unnamed protein product [Bursaphelenchus xylophilus]
MLHGIPLLNLATNSQNYKNKVPSIELKYKGAYETFTISSLLDLNTEFSFVFSDKCQHKGNCTADEHKVVNPARVPDQSGFDDSKYDPVFNFKGIYYDMDVSIGDLTQNHRVGVVTEGKPEQEYLADGRLGLGFGNKTYAVIDKLFANMDTDKTVYIKQGVFVHPTQKTDGRLQREDQKGEVSLGKLITGCNQLEFSDALEHDGKVWWQVEATVKIGADTFEKQRVAFNPSRGSFVNAAAFEAHFRQAEFNSLTELPTFSITFNEKEHKMAPKDYVVKAKRDDNTEYYLAYIGKAQNSNYDFVLGYEFLQRKCLALRKDGSKYQVGLSPYSAGNKVFGSFSLLLSLLYIVKVF